MSKIIPACAGKRTLGTPPDPAGWDHPRVRGEELETAREELEKAGSPPRVRGRGGAGPGDGPEAVDHPRACGEEYQLNLGERVVLGSPPRVRGRVRAVPGPAPFGGITPARAGKSADGRACIRVLQDHPRACGEEPGRRWCRPGRAGSPPRVRGRADTALHHQNPIGITPACAGKRAVHLRKIDRSQDHPRVRGEESFPSCAALWVWGSPPRARGRTAPGGVGSAPRRITPAYAGKSKSLASTRR